MSRGVDKFFLWLILTTAFCSNGFTQKNISLRSDTIYLDTVINGKPQVLRTIRVYDTLWLFSNLDYRSGKPLFQYSGFLIKDTISPNLTTEFKSKPWYEAGFSYYNTPGFFDEQVFSDYGSAMENIHGIGAFVNVFAPMNKFYLRSGLDLNYFEANVNDQFQLQKIDSTINLVPYTYDSIIIDTAYFLDINQLPDTVYIMHVDTFNYTVQDTLEEVDYDTTYNKKNLTFTNRYFYIEMPLLFGYTFNFSPFELGLEGGVYLTWLARVKGNAINKNHSLRQLNEKYFHRLNLDLALRFRVIYNLPSTNAITITPGLRYTFFDIYRNDQVVARKIPRLFIALGYNFY